MISRIHREAANVYQKLQPQNRKQSIEQIISISGSSIYFNLTLSRIINSILSRYDENVFLFNVNEEEQLLRFPAGRAIYAEETVQSD